MDFKKFLLENDVVIDNEYLDKYVELIVRNINTPREKYKTDSHHIIPRAYFKLNGLECDNSKENKVNLYRDEHMLAHLYLSKCATKTYEYTLTLPINRLMAKYNNGENTEIETFIKEHQEEINEAKEKISKLQSNKLKGHSYLTKEGRERKSEFSKKLRTEKNNLGKKGLVYNGVYMFVPISEVDDYIEKGAVLGRWAHSEESKEKNRIAHIGKSHPMSDELKEKLRQINTGRTLSDECKKQIGETLKKNYPHGQIAGKIAISNDELNITKYIFEDEFEEYEKQGYRKGRIKKK